MKCIRCGADLGDRPSCPSCGAARPETVSVPRGEVSVRRDEAPTIPELFPRREVEEPEAARSAPSPRPAAAPSVPSPRLPFPQTEASEPPSAPTPSQTSSLGEERVSTHVGPGPSAAVAAPALAPLPTAVGTAGGSAPEAVGASAEDRTPTDVVGFPAAAADGESPPNPRPAPTVESGGPSPTQSAAPYPGSRAPAPPAGSAPTDERVGSGSHPALRSLGVAPSHGGREAHPIPLPSPMRPTGTPRPARLARGPVVEVKMAGFWRRGLATLIDLALVAGVVLLVLKIGIGSLDLSTLPKSPLWGVDYLVFVVLQHPDRAWPIVFFVLGTLFGYLFLFQAILGSTPGKLLLKMRIVGPRGQRIGPVRALARTLAYGVSACFFMMGFLWAAFDLERRALHDVLCGSYVVVGDPQPREGTAATMPAKRRAAA